MSAKIQDKIVVELTISSEGRELWPDAQPRFITLFDHAAAAFRKLFAAAEFGVHQTEFRPDALARLDQAGVRFETISRPRYGTGGATCWTRLAFGRAWNVAIVEGA